jgi:hypothetical protein
MARERLDREHDDGSATVGVFIQDALAAAG